MVEEVGQVRVVNPWLDIKVLEESEERAWSVAKERVLCTRGSIFPWFECRWELCNKSWVSICVKEQGVRKEVRSRAFWCSSCLLRSNTMEWNVLAFFRVQRLKRDNRKGITPRIGSPYIIFSSRLWASFQADTRTRPKLGLKAEIQSNRQGFNRRKRSRSWIESERRNFSTIPKTPGDLHFSYPWELPGFERSTMAATRLCPPNPPLPKYNSSFWNVRLTRFRIISLSIINREGHYTS